MTSLNQGCCHLGVHAHWIVYWFTEHTTPNILNIWCLLSWLSNNIVNDNSGYDRQCPWASVSVSPFTHLSNYIFFSNNGLGWIECNPFKSNLHTQYKMVPKGCLGLCNGTSLGHLLIYPPQIATVMKPISFSSKYSPVSHTKSLGESREWKMVF